MSRPHLDAGRRAVVLYCGDLDPAGNDISNRLPGHLLDLDGTYYDLSLFNDGREGRLDVRLKPGEIEVVRFGLNYDLIERLGLSWVDNMESGSKPKPGKKKIPLNNPEHEDFKRAYVQDYIRDYCNGYKKGGYYHTDTPRKCEANALLADIDAGRQLCEDAIQEQLQDLDCIDRYEDKLKPWRDELREIVSGSKGIGGTR